MCIIIRFNKIEALAAKHCKNIILISLAHSMYKLCDMFFRLFYIRFCLKSSFLVILFPASCGIPFQVLPDYQEGAEQVSWHVST